MTNLVNKIKIPKKIRSFYYKDINFSIQDFVLNKDITNIPGNGNLIKIAFNAKYIFYTLLVIFALFTLPILTFFPFHLCFLAGVKIVNVKKITYYFGIIAGCLWGLAWIIFFTNIFIVGFIYVNKKIKPIIDYFNKLVEEKKLVADLRKYPVVFAMAFYYKNRSQFRIDYPNTYPWFSPYFALVGLGIFFDRLYDYINQINKI